jgi:hypothetical protein
MKSEERDAISAGMEYSRSSESGITRIKKKKGSSEYARTSKVEEKLPLPLKSFATPWVRREKRNQDKNPPSIRKGRIARVKTKGERTAKGRILSVRSSGMEAKVLMTETTTMMKTALAQGFC